MRREAGARAEEMVWRKHGTGLRAWGREGRVGEGEGRKRWKSAGREGGVGGLLEGERCVNFVMTTGFTRPEIRNPSAPCTPLQVGPPR